jgi:glycerol-3-phosphate O-acyltransferase / dihydroxyacetone phosphate acyltransferase
LLHIKVTFFGNWLLIKLYKAMIYDLLKSVFRIALKLYFRKIKVNFAENLPTDKPILFVSNHQSSFMDAILITCMLKRQLHFMSRGESFNTPLKRYIFRQFNMNPIYRKEHSPKLTSKNSALIEGFQRLLLNKHSILIFPEGISHVEPRLFPIKKGAARVILGAQALANHEILLVPIGLNYENPHRFRRKVLVNFGNAIGLKKYNNIYCENERLAVDQLSKRIKYELEELMLNVENEELNRFVPVLQTIYEKELIEKSPIELPKEKKAFRIRKDIIQGMHFFEKTFPLRARRIKEGLLDYQQLLSNHKINDKWLEPKFQKSSQKKPLTNIFFYLIGLPIFLYGFINHLAILKLPPLIVERVIKRPDFRGSLLLSFGVLCFVGFYVFQIILFGWVSKSLAWTLVYALTLPFSGWFSLYYFRKFWKLKERLEFNRHLKNNGQMLDYLTDKREQLLHQLRLARQAFLAFSEKV